MKKLDLIIENEYDEDGEVWLDTGDSVIKLPPDSYTTYCTLLTV